MAINSIGKSNSHKSSNNNNNEEDDHGSSEEIHWYIPDSARASTEKGVLTALTFLILYSYIIPISLYVSLEVSKRRIHYRPYRG